MILALIVTASATMVSAALDPFALAALSDHVVQGTVIAVEPRWHKKLIWTVAVVQSSSGAENLVWMPGGCIDGRCLTVAGVPSVEAGDEVYVFMRGNELTSLSQGLFYVSGNIAVRDTRGLAVAHGARPEARYSLADLEAAAEKIPGR